MKKFFLIVNPTRDAGLLSARNIEGELKKRGLECCTHVTSRNDGLERYTESSMIPEDTDCILVLGGDGTLIQAADDVADLDIPLLGINTGRLGFLTDVEMDGISAAIDALSEDRYLVDERMMITGGIISKEKEICRESASMIS